MWILDWWPEGCYCIFVPRPPKQSELGSRIVSNLTRRLDLPPWYTTGFT